MPAGDQGRLPEGERGAADAQRRVAAIHEPEAGQGQNVLGDEVFGAHAQWGYGRLDVSRFSTRSRMRINKLAVWTISAASLGSSKLTSRCPVGLRKTA